MIWLTALVEKTGLAFIWKYRVRFAFCFLLLCIPAAYGIGYWDGGSSKEDKIENAGLKDTVETKEKISEIRNHRPDDDQLFNILQSHTF